MPDIFRPIKTFGTDRYTSEIAANAPNDTIIKATEVDADLNLLYATINDLDDANIAIGANINGAKIAAGTVPVSKLVPGQITDTQISATANINGSKLLDNSIIGAKLTVNTITARELATFPIVRQVVSATPAASLNFTTTETAVVTFPAVTVAANSHIVIFGTWNLTLWQNGGGVVPAVALYVKRGGTAFYTLQTLVQLTSATEPARQVPYPAPFAYDTVPGGGTFVYAITMVTSHSILAVRNDGTLGLGNFHLLELVGSIG